MYRFNNTIQVEEMKYGDDFAYVLEENGVFAGTDYKILQNAAADDFVPCMKILYNGRIQLYYHAEGYQTLKSIMHSLEQNDFLKVIINLMGNIIRARKNGFLNERNIELATDKIFVEKDNGAVKLVYLPVAERNYFSAQESEREIKEKLVAFITEFEKELGEPSREMVNDLTDSIMGIEQIYEKYNIRIGLYMGKSSGDSGEERKLVSLNAPSALEIKLEKRKTVLGKKKELVDVVIPFNKMISRIHCTIFYENGRYYIIDEESANGTYVNRIRLTKNRAAEIRKGDIIRLADSDFQVV